MILDQAGVTAVASRVVAIWLLLASSAVAQCQSSRAAVGRRFEACEQDATVVTGWKESYWDRSDQLGYSDGGRNACVIEWVKGFGRLLDDDLLTQPAVGINPMRLAILILKTYPSCLESWLALPG